MQPRERQDVRGYGLRVAAHVVDIRHALGIEVARHIARHDHRQVTPARVGGKLLDKIFDRRTVEAVADNHAVDVACAEIAARRLDRECADQVGALADRDGERRVAAPAARDQHGRILDRVGVGEIGRVEPLGKLLRAPQDGCMQRAHAQRCTKARNEPGRNLPGQNW